ncbi:hypothetical protein RKD23_007963 [Streptomyces sp. SAI-170]
MRTRCRFRLLSPQVHACASSPVIASPTSPAAAIPRSPLACADPGAPAACGITGLAVRRERSPVTARPILPPAATDRVPTAVAAGAAAEAAGGRRKAYPLTAAAAKPPTDPATVAIWADVSRSATVATMPSPNAARPSSTTNSHTTTRASPVTSALSQGGLTATASSGSPRPREPPPEPGASSQDRWPVFAPHAVQGVGVITMRQTHLAMQGAVRRAARRGGQQLRGRDRRIGHGPASHAVRPMVVPPSWSSLLAPCTTARPLTPEPGRRGASIG